MKMLFLLGKHIQLLLVKMLFNIPKIGFEK